MNLKRTLSATVLAFALTMMPAFVACSPDDNKTDIETPDKPNKPENPDPEPEPNPNPEPEPEPGPNPEPSVTTGAKWFELPAVNAKKEGTKYLVDAENSDLYYGISSLQRPGKICPQREKSEKLHCMLQQKPSLPGMGCCNQAQQSSSDRTGRQNQRLRKRSG